MPENLMLSLIERLSADLDAQHVPHALTGSVASSLHGEPFTSIDIDIVVSAGPEVAERLAALWSDLSADETSLRRAALEHGLATLLHLPSGLKIDVSFLQGSEYDKAVLARRVRFSPEPGQPGFWVVSPEDVILLKLRRRDMRSEKQWRDSLGVARAMRHRLDWSYLRIWARQLGLEGDLDALIREAGL